MEKDIGAKDVLSSNDSDGTSKEEIKEIIYRGLTDLQVALFRQVSRQKSRLEKLDDVIDVAMSKIFREDTLDTLPPKDLVKLLGITMESHSRALGFLERLYKAAPSSEEVYNITKTLSVTQDGEVMAKSSEKFKLDPERKVMLTKVLAEQIVKSSDKTS